MKKYRMQLIFGLPILIFAISMIACDTSGLIDVEPFGFAFFGSIITTFITYYFRKSPPSEGS